MIDWLIIFLLQLGLTMWNALEKCSLGIAIVMAMFKLGIYILFYDLAQAFSSSYILLQVKHAQCLILLKLVWQNTVSRCHKEPEFGLEAHNQRTNRQWTLWGSLSTAHIWSP